MSKFLKDFRDFAMRGNVIDMAVGVVIGAAFGKIVSSLVDDIIMPLVGVATGGINFTDYKWVIQPETKNAAGEVIAPLVSLNWGNWVQAVVNFDCGVLYFCDDKVYTEFAQEEGGGSAPAATPAPTKEEVLLTEIRDLLKEQKR